MKPLLSIAMIVKNEKRCIERSLKALQPLRDHIPCEIVVADTGSDDGTKEIVQQYADICFDFEWVNDFAAARNAAIARCTGKWLLNLDADEYLEPDYTELIEFLTGKESERYDMAYINVLNYSDFAMTGEGRSFFACRMAKMASHPYYEGSIHEYLQTKNKGGESKYLSNVRFKHDGYAMDNGHFQEKMKRNIALLEHELEKRPKDLRLLHLVIRDGQYRPALRLESAYRAMELLDQDHTSRRASHFGPWICREAMGVALEQDLPEREQWTEQMFSWFPKSIVLGTDVCYALLMRAYREKQYERVPQLVNTFLYAWERYGKNEFKPLELTGGSLSAIQRSNEMNARACGCQVFGQLGRTEEAVEMLRGETGWDEANPGDLQLLRSALWSAEDEGMQRVVAEVVRTLRAIPGTRGAELWEATCKVAGIVFEANKNNQEAPERAWRMFRYTDGVLGQAAQLMEAESEERRTLLAEVEDWKHMPRPVMLRMIQEGASMPQRFYQQSKEQLEMLASQLCAGLPMRVVADWIDHRWSADSLAHRQFRFMLQAGLMQNDAVWNGEEKEEEEERSAEIRKLKAKLCRQFADAAADFLPSLYSDALMADEEEWNVLPATHTFALYLLRGRDAKQKGDEVGYVRALQSALSAVESAKNIVEYLLDHPAWQQPVSPELAALAEQVRTILAQYPSDDLMVQQLKSSPVYQQVAHLIEE